MPTGDYTKTVWVFGDVVTVAKANNWETQFEEAKFAIEEGMVEIDQAALQSWLLMIGGV